MSFSSLCSLSHSGLGTFIFFLQQKMAKPCCRRKSPMTGATIKTSVPWLGRSSETWNRWKFPRGFHDEMICQTNGVLILMVFHLQILNDPILKASVCFMICLSVCPFRNTTRHHWKTAFLLHLYHPKIVSQVLNPNQDKKSAIIAFKEDIFGCRVVGRLVVVVG